MSNLGQRPTKSSMETLKSFYISIDSYMRSTYKISQNKIFTQDSLLPLEKSKLEYNLYDVKKTETLVFPFTTGSIMNISKDGKNYQT